jgi:hypothetical protein
VTRTVQPFAFTTLTKLAAVDPIRAHKAIRDKGTEPQQPRTGTAAGRKRGEWLSSHVGHDRAKPIGAELVSLRTLEVVPRLKPRFTQRYRYQFPAIGTKEVEHFMLYS